MNKSDLPHLKALLREVEDGIGGEVWDILHSWERGPQRPAAPGERGGGLAGAEDVDAARDRLEDARCARWWAEYVDLATNLQAPLRRMLKLHDLASRATQAPAVLTPDEDWCRSCMRAKEISPRKVGDLCDFCWSHQKETRRLPDVDLIRAKHEGRKLKVAAKPRKAS